MKKHHKPTNHERAAHKNSCTTANRPTCFTKWYRIDHLTSTPPPRRQAPTAASHCAILVTHLRCISSIFSTNNRVSVCSVCVFVAGSPRPRHPRLLVFSSPLLPLHSSLFFARQCQHEKHFKATSPPLQTLLFRPFSQTEHIKVRSPCSPPHCSPSVSVVLVASAAQHKPLLWAGSPGLAAAIAACTSPLVFVRKKKEKLFIRHSS